MFGMEYIQSLIEKVVTSQAPTELTGKDGGPHMALSTAADSAIPAGQLRIWQGAGDSLIDRMIHFRLIRDPVDTQLFFLFGLAATPMPHFHVQVVQLGPDTCVFNADYLPRLDPIDHPDYFTEVFAPLTKPYWKAINDKQSACALAPGNPRIATYLSPWSIGSGRPTNHAEFAHATPLIDTFLSHYLDLASQMAYAGPPPDQLRDRNRRHLELFFDDSLDPRAWKGVYSVIGEPVGRKIKDIFKTELRT
jgi:hypothetical protein